jgi:hypothetical protein
MDTYRALDITEQVKEICPENGICSDMQEQSAKGWQQDGRILRVGKIEKKHDQIKVKQYGKDGFSIGRDTVELKYVEQIADGEQTTTLSMVLKYLVEQLEKNPKQELRGLLEQVCRKLEKDGPGALSRGNVPGNLAEVRPQEIYACVNRYRGFRR